MKTIIFAVLSNLICTLPSLQSPEADQTELEDAYIKHFGNHGESQFWDMARCWYLDHREPRLKLFCKEAHKQSGYGIYGTEGTNNTQLRQRTLAFMNPKYEPRLVDIVMYGINGFSEMRPDRYFFFMWRDDYWYITEGENDNCVYYVTHENKTAHAFRLVKRVCDIHVDYNLNPLAGHY